MGPHLGLRSTTFALFLTSAVAFMAAQPGTQPSRQPVQVPATAQPPSQNAAAATNPPGIQADSKPEPARKHRLKRKKTPRAQAGSSDVPPAVITDRPRPGSTSTDGEQPGHSIPKDYVEYDLSKGSYSGETLRGPVTVWATHLNTIRWDYEFNSVSTYKVGPDLSGSLTLTPVVTQSGTTVSPTNLPAPSLTPQGSQPRSHRGLHATVAQSKPPQALLDLEKQADNLVDKTTVLHTHIETESKSIFVDPLTKLSTLNTDLIKLQNTANDAVALVTQAGAALQSYLKSTGNNIPDLVSQTNQQLGANSAFTKGVNAAWPDPSNVLKLQNDLAGNALNLNNSSKAIATDLTDLQNMEKNLGAIKDQLISQNAQYQSATADPTTDADVKAHVSNIDSAVQVIQADETYANATSGIFTAAIAQNQTITSNAALLAPTSTNYQSFVTAITTLKAWHDRMDTKMKAYDEWKAQPSVKPDPFAIYRDATCAFAFSGTKDTTVTLTRVDLTPAQSSPAAETPLTVTVECTTPFSISAGVVFSTIRDNQYEAASKTTTDANGISTTTNYIRQTSGSPFHPLPLALANVRLYEWNEHVAIYSSFGIAANIRGQNAGGSTAEYLLGPSLGFFRGVFLTAGAHFGNEVTVGGGYKVGNSLPTGQNTVPLSTNYHAGFGLAVTFTKP